jgi:predicted ABC-type ATPase
MPSPKPTIYLIAGCNGAGKTTFAKEFLPHEVKCLRFYNADELARGLSPLDPSAAAIKAGRLLLDEIRHSITRKETFALESTLSGTTYGRLLEQAKTSGYRIYLHYLWLPTVTIAIARVRERVRKGGHNVPVADIKRRFERSLRHLVSVYTPLADRWALWNNASQPPALVAESGSCSLTELAAILERL